MVEMMPFQYVEFYDVPRCITLRYREKLLLLQSAFDENLDDYPTSYSVYVLPESVQDALQKSSWKFLDDTPMTCIGRVQVAQVAFDPSKRKELDASLLDGLLAEHERITK